MQGVGLGGVIGLWWGRVRWGEVALAGVALLGSRLVQHSIARGGAAWFGVMVSISSVYPPC
jgi:hypothetical protein